MLTVKPKYCFRPKVSISKGFGLFQQLRYNLSLHFTPQVCSVQSAFYTDFLSIIPLDVGEDIVKCS